MYCLLKLFILIQIIALIGIIIYGIYSDKDRIETIKDCLLIEFACLWFFCFVLTFITLIYACKFDKFKFYFTF